MLEPRVTLTDQFLILPLLAGIAADRNNSGAVVCCEGKVPDGGVAAVLRYRAPEPAQPELAVSAPK